MEIKEIIPGIKTAFLDKTNKCPHCNTVFNVATKASDDGTDIYIPSPGDYSICIECLSYLRFDDDLQLIALEADDIVRVPNEILSELTGARRRMKQIKKEG